MSIRLRFISFVVYDSQVLHVLIVLETLYVADIRTVYVQQGEGATDA